MYRRYDHSVLPDDPEFIPGAPVNVPDHRLCCETYVAQVGFHSFTWWCTRPSGHEMPHAAHSDGSDSPLCEMYAIWDDDRGTD